MISWGTAAAFSALAFVVIVIPGPSVLFIVGRALQHDRRDALMSVVGNTGGELVHAALVAADAGVAPARRPARRVLAESFTVGVTNPKTLVFVAAVLPQFVVPAAGGVMIGSLGVVLMASRRAA